MKSFKNHCFMLTIMALSIFNTNFIHTEEANFEQPDIQNQPSKSFFDRFKESEFNKRLSDKVNNFTRQSHDFFFKKYSKPEPTIAVEKPTNEDSSTLNFKTAEPVTYGAGDLPDEEFPSAPDNLTDWDNVSLHDVAIDYSTYSPETLSKVSPESLAAQGAQLLKQFDAAQFDALTPSQIDAFLKLKELNEDPDLKKALLQAARIKGVNRFTIFQRDMSMDQFKNIFKSDKTILKEWMQNSIKTAGNDEFMNSKRIRQTVAKLSRTERMELFNDITHEELDDKALGDRTQKRADEIFERNAKLFSKIIPEHEMLVETINPNQKIVTKQFELVNMRQVDPNLSLAENAKQIEKAQGLNDNLEHLEKNMRTYLETHPTVRNLQTLLVDATDQTRATGLKAKSNEISKIFAIPGMKEQFDTLTSKEKDQFITNITQAEIRLKETNRNLAGSGAKVSYAEAKRIFQENAALFEKIIGQNKILAPIESAARNNVSSFTFETIDISKYKKNLKAIWDNRDNTEAPLYKAYQSKGGALPQLDFDLTKTAFNLKQTQNLKLTTADIVQELKNYLNRTYPNTPRQ